MPRTRSEETRQQWKETILNQLKSGLSVACWCDQNNLSLDAFGYWKRVLFPKSKPTLERSSFAEIPENQDNSLSMSTETGITLEYQGIRILLENEFDALALKKCLAVLKEEIC